MWSVSQKCPVFQGTEGYLTKHNLNNFSYGIIPTVEALKVKHFWYGHQHFKIGF